MINRSKKGDPRQWKKWREAGSLAKHPDQERRERRAELIIEAPDGTHNNFKISFSSEGKDEDWRAAYAFAIMDIAKEKGLEPFFQTGHDLIESYQSIELWEVKDKGAIESVLEEIHEEAQKRIDKFEKRKSK